MTQNPARPETVPEDAIWNAEGGLWEQGKRFWGVRIGLHRFWRKDGSRHSHVVYNDKGQKEGQQTTYHPDGAVAREERFQGGEQSGISRHHRPSQEATTDIEFPLESTSVRRIDITFERGKPAKHAYFNGDDEQVRADGALVSRADESRNDLSQFFAKADPQTFFPSQCTIFTTSVGAAKPPISGADDLTERFHEAWGIKPPAELEEFFRMVSTCMAGGVSPWQYDIYGYATEEENLTVGELCSEVAIARLFGGCEIFGEAPNGDSWAYDVVGSEWRIYAWDHAELVFDRVPYATNLSSFSFLVALNHALSKKHIKAADAREALQKARGLVCPYRGFNTIARLDKELSNPDARPCPSETPYDRWQRARWIACLLFSDGAHPEEAVEFFNEQNAEVTAATWQDWLSRARNEVPTALYLLLRTFWLQEDEWLEQLVDSFENSPARLVADGVKLVKGLSVGKNLLVMEDVHRVREQFLAKLRNPGSGSRLRRTE